MEAQEMFYAFRGDQLLARGTIASVARALREAAGGQCKERLSLYVERTGAPTDIDVSGTEQEMLQRLADQFPKEFEAEGPDDSGARRGPGRPRLGVTSKEVSLLPRHWDWLKAQRGGASSTLRRLVEDARKKHATADFVRQRVEAAHRFLWDIAGNAPDFEEATRALFAHDFSEFERRIAAFPVDVQSVLLRYVGEARAAEQAAQREGR
jgi:hypothetical protein